MTLSSPPVIYKSFGILRYNQDNGYKLVVEAEEDLANYYFSLIPKKFGAKKGRYKPHITIVRSLKEIPPNLEFWGKYDGELVEFIYEPIIRHGGEYFWLNILCVRFEEIRLELGLEARSQYTRPPEGFERYFHMTLGNIKTDLQN